MEFTCPSCGAKQELQPGMLSLVCKYCNSVSKIERDVLVDTGQKSLILPFPSIFEVGKNIYIIEDDTSNNIFIGKKVEYIDEKEFYEKKLEKYFAKVYIYGQIRYTNDGGFWDDWFVRILDSKKEIDRNKNYILKEDEGLISFQLLKDIDNDNKNNEILSLNAGEIYQGFFIQESGIFEIEGFLGTFPFLVENQQAGKYVNLNGYNSNIELKQIGDYILFLQNI